MNKLTILWLDDKREPYKYFAKMEKDKQKNKELSDAGRRNDTFYNNNVFNQYDVTFVWVKNLDDFSNYIISNGLPEFISFDRDLTPSGWKKEHTEEFPDGLACIKWLKQYCASNNLNMPKCYVHSANWKQIPEMQRELGSAALHQAMSGKGKSIDESRNKLVIKKKQLQSIICEQINNFLKRKRIISESINEIRGSHISSNDFDSFTNNYFGTGEGKAPAHGYGTYVSIDPKGNARYFLQSIRSDHYVNGQAQSYYYDIEIPDISESNYLFENYPISRIPQQLANIKQHLLKLGINIEQNPEYSEDMSCKRLLQLINTYLSNDKFAEYRTIPNSKMSAASGLMVQCGIVGMIYYGKSDKTCAVIFDPSMVKIVQKTDLRNELGDIQPVDGTDNKKKDPRKQIQKRFNDSEFYNQRLKNYEENPFDLDKYYNYKYYVNKDDDKARQQRINKITY